MSTEDRKGLPPDEAWDALEKMAVDDEVDRVLALSDEQLDAELEKGSANPARVRQRGEDLGRRLEAERAEGRTRAGKGGMLRRRWRTWLVAAAVGGLAAATFGATYAPLVAWLRPVPIGPDDGGGIRRHPPEFELATTLRRRAVFECDRGDLDVCRATLDEAAGLDPAGETRPEVEALRRVIAAKPEGGKLK